MSQKVIMFALGVAVGVYVVPRLMPAVKSAVSV